MKKTAFLSLLVITLFAPRAGAQWAVSPSVYLGGSGLYYPDDNPYGLTSGGSWAYGVDAKVSHNVSDAFSIGAGLGLRKATRVDSVLAGSAEWMPVFVGARLGSAIFVKAALGYNVPLGSNSLGYVTGWFAAIGAGMDLSPLIISVDIDFLHLFGSKTLAYVPNGYVASSSGFLMGVRVEWFIPFEK